MYRTVVIPATALLLIAPALASAAPIPDVTDLVPDPTNRPTHWMTVSLLTPLAGAEVGGKIVIEGVAEAERGYKVRGVSIYVDGVYMGSAQGLERWTYALDTRTLLDGEHTFHVVGWATPAVTPVFVGVGHSVTAKFRTLNQQMGVTLFDETIDVKAASAGAWVIPVERDYTGLRVTLEGLGSRDLLSGPRAQMLLAYKHADPDAPSERTWLLTYGALHAGGFLSKPPHGVLKAPGVLALTGVFAGEGAVRVKIEAVPLSTLT